MISRDPAPDPSNVQPQGAVSFRAQLGLIDFSLLVIGAIVGDGVYVVAAMGSGSLGPAQLIAWLVAGLLAAFIALAFIQCAAIHPGVGGSYSYAGTAFGPFVGFLAGWTLYVGEWAAVSAFPTAFFNYFRALMDAPASWALPVKLTLIAVITGINLLGVRQGARTNDALTVAKLLPLALLAVLGLVFVVARFHDATAHLEPFAPLGWGNFGRAILPIFWAYAGFELAVLPAAEVRHPGKTLPRGLLIGAAVSTVFYLLTNLAVVVAAPWQDVAASSHPLALAMDAMMRSLAGPADLGARLMSLGALVSIAGVFVVFMLGLARLSYALAVDNFLPAAFGKIDSRSGTPYVGIVFLAVCSCLGSTVFDLRALLSTAVVFLSLCYLITALSALRLIQREPYKALHLPGIRVLLGLAVASSVYLAAQATPLQAGIAAAVLGLGMAIYMATAKRRRLAIRDTSGAWSVDHHMHAWLQRTLSRFLRWRSY